ncbi:MAG: sigma-70 family RNA polymerase sigma factor [Candidatus Omnitrophica bacterium]|nr:sigma-70 family RNA polymerase sigma factor [Candidatus Omnitrophota bacterium]
MGNDAIREKEVLQGAEEEDSLILLCRDGDREAFNSLMLKYHRRVFNTALRMLGDYSQADEAAQDVFVRAYRGIQGFRQQSSFLTWLYAITVNIVRNKMKQNCRISRLNVSLDAAVDNGESSLRQEVPDRQSAAPDKALLNKEKQILIYKAIRSLDADFRVVVVLRDMQMLSYEEIAQVLAVNIGTVKSRLFRARQMLQESLKDVI